MDLPQPDPQKLLLRDELILQLSRALPPDQVIHRPEDLIVYECDALSAYRQLPMAVVLPSSTDEVAAAVRTCAGLEIPIIPWGAGTGLSGGALPRQDGVVISLARMNQILDIDFDNGTAMVESGVTNLAVSNAVAAAGFYYAPDPSSQLACTIGGNIAENSGGVHCLKYGTTTNNVLGLEIVLADGMVVDIGGKAMERGGYDLLAHRLSSNSALTARRSDRPPTFQASGVYCR